MNNVLFTLIIFLLISCTGEKTHLLYSPEKSLIDSLNSKSEVENFVQTIDTKLIGFRLKEFRILKTRIYA
jgi:hypothetical protein